MIKRMEEESSKKGYGKRPLWQWIVLYLVIGAIVYGLVYYFVLAKKGGNYNYGSSSPSTSTPQQSSPY